MEAKSSGSVASSGGMRYAGFWIRFLAYIIDGIILGVVGRILFGLDCVVNPLLQNSHTKQSVVFFSKTHGFFLLRCVFKLDCVVNDLPHLWQLKDIPN
jgi:hypothetical protein